MNFNTWDRSNRHPGPRGIPRGMNNRGFRGGWRGRNRNWHPNSFQPAFPNPQNFGNWSSCMENSYNSYGDPVHHPPPHMNLPFQESPQNFMAYNARPRFNPPFLNKPKSRSSSPLPGSEEYTQTKIQQTSELIKRQLNIDSNDANMESCQFNTVTSEHNRTSSMTWQPNFGLCDSVNDKKQLESGKDTPPIDNISFNNVQRKQNKPQNRTPKPNKPIDVREIRDKIIDHISNMNYAKIKNLVNQPNSTNYDFVMQQIQKQKKLELSRALRDMSKRQTQEEGDSAVINAIIPDIGIKIEDLPKEVIAELSSTLNCDLDLHNNSLNDPESYFKQAQDMCSNFDASIALDNFNEEFKDEFLNFESVNTKEIIDSPHFSSDPPENASINTTSQSDLLNAYDNFTSVSQNYVPCTSNMHTIDSASFVSSPNISRAYCSPLSNTVQSPLSNHSLNDNFENASCSAVASIAVRKDLLEAKIENESIENTKLYQEDNATSDTSVRKKIVLKRNSQFTPDKSLEASRVEETEALDIKRDIPNACHSFISNLSDHFTKLKSQTYHVQKTPDDKYQDLNYPMTSYENTSSHNLLGRKNIEESSSQIYTSSPILSPNKTMKPLKERLRLFNEAEEIRKQSKQLKEQKTPEGNFEDNIALVDHQFEDSQSNSNPERPKQKITMDNLICDLPTSAFKMPSEMDTNEEPKRTMWKSPGERKQMCDSSFNLPPSLYEPGEEILDYEGSIKTTESNVDEIPKDLDLMSIEEADSIIESGVNLLRAAAVDDPNMSQQSERYDETMKALIENTSLTLFTGIDNDQMEEDDPSLLNIDLFQDPEILSESEDLMKMETGDIQNKNVENQSEIVAESQSVPAEVATTTEETENALENNLPDPSETPIQVESTDTVKLEEKLSVEPSQIAKVVEDKNNTSSTSFVDVNSHPPKDQSKQEKVARKKEVAGKKNSNKAKAAVKNKEETRQEENPKQGDKSKQKKVENKTDDDKADQSKEHVFDAPKSASKKVESKTGKDSSKTSGKTQEAIKSNPKLSSNEKSKSLKDPSGSRGNSNERPKDSSKSSRRSKSRDRAITKPRRRSKSKTRDRSKSKPRERSKSKERNRSDSKNSDKLDNKNRGRSRSKHRDRSKSIEKVVLKGKGKDHKEDRSRKSSLSKDKSNTSLNSKPKTSEDKKSDEKSDEVKIKVEKKTVEDKSKRSITNEVASGKKDDEKAKKGKGKDLDKKAGDLKKSEKVVQKSEEMSKKKMRENESIRKLNESTATKHKNEEKSSCGNIKIESLSKKIVSSSVQTEAVLNKDTCVQTEKCLKTSSTQTLSSTKNVEIQADFITVLRPNEVCKASPHSSSQDQKISVIQSALSMPYAIESREERMTQIMARLACINSDMLALQNEQHMLQNEMYRLFSDQRIYQSRGSCSTSQTPEHQKEISTTQLTNQNLDVFQEEATTTEIIKNSSDIVANKVEYRRKTRTRRKSEVELINDETVLVKPRRLRSRNVEQCNKKLKQIDGCCDMQNSILNESLSPCNEANEEIVTSSCISIKIPINTLDMSKESPIHDTYTVDHKPTATKSKKSKKKGRRKKSECQLKLNTTPETPEISTAMNECPKFEEIPNENAVYTIQSNSLNISDEPNMYEAENKRFRKKTVSQSNSFVEEVNDEPIKIKFRKTKVYEIAEPLVVGDVDHSMSKSLRCRSSDEIVEVSTVNTPKPASRKRLKSECDNSELTPSKKIKACEHDLESKIEEIEELVVKDEHPPTPIFRDLFINLTRINIDGMEIPKDEEGIDKVQEENEDLSSGEHDDKVENLEQKDAEVKQENYYRLEDKNENHLENNSSLELAATSENHMKGDENIEMSNADLEDCSTENENRFREDGNKIPPNDLFDDQRIVNYHGFNGVILSVKIVSDILLAASDMGNIYCFNWKTGELIKTLKIASRPVTSICVVENAKRNIFFGSLDAQINCFDFYTLKISKTVKLNDAIHCIEHAWGYLFCGSNKGSIIRYQIDQEIEKSEKISEQSVLMVRATQEGARKILLVAARNHPVTVRDAMSCLLLRTIQTPSTVYSLLLQDSILYFGTSQHDILVYSFHDGNEICTYKASKGVVCLQIVGNLMFAACYDGNIYVFNVKTNESLGMIPGPGGLMLSMLVMDDYIIAGSRNSHLICTKIPQQYLEQR